MKGLILSACLLLLPTLLTSPDAAVAGKSPDSTIWGERDGLAALRQTFNHPLLNSSWVGRPCFLDLTTWFGLQCLNNRVISIALESIGLSCRIDNAFVLADFTELTFISFKNNSISGNMMDFSSNLNIETIDISMNKFTGPISDSLLNLNRLKSLQLYDNDLTGRIPPFNKTSLKAFNVSYNNLTGEIPTTAVLKSFDESSYIGNSYLCGPPSPNPCRPIYEPPNRPKKRSKRSSKSLLLTLFITLDAIGLIALLWSIFAFCKRKRGRRNDLKEKSGEVGEEEKDEKGSEEKKAVVSEEQGKIVFVNGEGSFDFNDLLNASAEGLGKGSFGSCYKAVLDDGRAFVVKRLRDVSPMTNEEFAKEMRALAALKHRNLLPLLGYYYSDDEKLLIYNAAWNGNLFDRIHGGGRAGNTRIPFKWNSRLSVAKAVARAIEFLHRNTKGPGPVPHGNLKSSNVLLDADDTALVSDYGLIPLVSAPLAAQRMSSYRSPEYQHGRKVYKKSDVWSYGCLLLELVTGKIPAHSAPRGIEGVELVNWVHCAVREEWTYEVFDAEIWSQSGAARGLFKLLQVALWCCERSLEKRPEMGEVVRELEAIMPSDEEEEEEEESTERSDESTSINGSSSGGVGEER